MTNEAAAPLPKKGPKPENIWLNLICNVALPTIVLMKLSPWNLTVAILIACSLPISYGIYDWFARGKVNFLSILGLVAVALKGLFALNKKDALWIACSEAALPLLFGLAVLWTTRWEVPLVQRFLLSPQVFDLDRLRHLMALRGNADRLRPLMVTASRAYAGMMLLSATLNFVLAKAVLRAEPGSAEFGVEMGKLNGLQYPVIALPLMAITIGLFFWIMNRLGHLTGVHAQDLLAAHHQPAPEPSGSGNGEP